MAEGMINGALVGPGSSHGNVTAGPCLSEYTYIYVTICYNLEYTCIIWTSEIQWIGMLNLNVM